MDQILEKNEKKAVTTLNRAAIHQYHATNADKTRTADLYIQVVSLLLNFARKTLDWPVDKVAEGIELHGRQKECERWPEWLMKSWPKACEAMGAHNALLAYYVGIYTGQRPGDIAAMRWDHFDGEYMSVAQEKTKARLSLYCPIGLRDILNDTPKRGAHLFARNLTQGIGYFAVAKEAKRVRDSFDGRADGFSLHGLRKAAAVQLAEAGCSDAEIQSVTGHKSLAMVQHYRKRAGQKRLSKAAQIRCEQNTE